jgi:hypothetical protein
VDVNDVNVDVNNMNVDVNDVDVNNANENMNNSKQVLLSQEVLLVNVNHLDVNMNAEAVDVNNVNENTNVNNLEQGLFVNVDHVNTETKEKVDVNVNRTKGRSLEAVVCELRHAREQELLRARKMGENYERGSSCPMYTNGKGFNLWKQEVEAVMVDIINAVMLSMYEKPETRDVMDGITDDVMLKHGVRGWRQDPLRQGVQHVREARDEGWDAQDQPQGQVRQEHKREQCEGQEQHGRPCQRSKTLLLSV